MFKDFCYFEYMKDENGDLDTDLMGRLTTRWIENAKLYYETDKYMYFIYKFKDSNAAVLIRIIKDNEGKLSYDDLQTIMIPSESFKVRIDAYNEETETAVLLTPENNEIFFTQMDIMDFKVGDEIYVNLNIFPIRVEIRENENDYYNHSQKADGGLNIFNITIGTVSPVMSMIMSERYKYPGITDEMLKPYREEFMIGSGKITNFERIDVKMSVEEDAGLDNNELPLGQVLNIEFETYRGHNIASVIEKMVFENFMHSENIENIKLQDNPIIKVYGYFSGYIDVEKSKK